MTNRENVLSKGINPGDLRIVKTGSFPIYAVKNGDSVVGDATQLVFNAQNSWEPISERELLTIWLNRQYVQR